MSAFIKKTKSRNGAAVIQVVFKQGRQVSKLVHVGTAHNDAEEAELRSLAQDIICKDQLTLDLFDDPQGLDIVLEHSYSEMLYNALEHVYGLLGFDGIGDETFKKLVLARIIEPTSKLDTIRVLKELGLESPSNSEIHRALRRTVENDYRNQLSLACFESASTHSLSLLLYDVTTLYFEAQKEDDYRKSGLSKERKLDPQITLGLLTGRDGFPLEVRSFEGNRAEVKTIIEVLDAFRSRHGLTGLTVTADAAMLSSGNVAAIKEAGYHFIIASRNAKTPYDVAEYHPCPDQEFYDGEIFETTMDMNTGSGGPRVKQRVIYQYRAKRASIDLINAEKRLEKAKRMVAGTMPLKRNKFVKITGAKREVNYTLVEKDRSIAGIKGYVTDLNVDAQEIIDAYHQLFQVERSFRMSKSDLRARPIFHHKRDSIEAHLTIVFAALAISRKIQDMTGVSIKKFRNTLAPVRTGRLFIGGKRCIIQPLIPSEAKALLDKIYR